MAQKVTNVIISLNSLSFSSEWDTVSREQRMNELKQESLGIVIDYSPLSSNTLPGQQSDLPFLPLSLYPEYNIQSMQIVDDNTFRHFVRDFLLQALLLQGFQLIHSVVLRIFLIGLCLYQQDFVDDIEIRSFFWMVLAYNIILSIKIGRFFYRSLVMETNELTQRFQSNLHQISYEPSETLSIETFEQMVWKVHIHKKLMVLYWLTMAYGNFVLLLNLKEIDINAPVDRILLLIMLTFYLYYAIPNIIFHSIFFTFPKISDITSLLQHNRSIKAMIDNLHVKRNRFLYDQEEVCVICMTEYQEDDNLIQLPCKANHQFHEQCIRQWLTKKYTCPVCREDIRKFYQNMLELLS